MSATSDTAAQMTVHPPELRRFESAPGGGDEVELMDRAGQGKASDCTLLFRFCTYWFSCKARSFTQRIS